MTHKLSRRSFLKRLSAGAAGIAAFPAIVPSSVFGANAPSKRIVMGAMMGIAGAPMPMYLAYVEPVSTFNLSYSISALAMPIIGGTSHWLGPLIGAIILGTLQQVVTVTISSELNVLVVGLLLVLFVVLAPEGVLGLVKKWKQSSK